MKVTHVLRRVVHGLMLPRSQGYPFHHVACHSGPGLPLTPSTANTCPLQFSSGRLPPAARVFMHHSVASMIPDIREVKQQARKRIKQRLRHLDSAQMATESKYFNCDLYVRQHTTAQRTLALRLSGTG